MFAYVIAALLFLGYYDDCYAEWVRYPFGNLSFHFNTEEKTWNDAKTACEADGGYLAEPSDCTKDTFLRLKLETKAQDWWIGGTDQEKEGQWKWEHSDVRFGCYTNWYPEEPNNSGGNQGCLRYWKDGQWDDYACNVKHPFICQKSSAK